MKQKIKTVPPRRITFSKEKLPFNIIYIYVGFVQSVCHCVCHGAIWSVIPPQIDKVKAKSCPTLIWPNNPSPILGCPDVTTVLVHYSQSNSIFISVTATVSHYHHLCIYWWRGFSFILHDNLYFMKSLSSPLTLFKHTSVYLMLINPFSVILLLVFCFSLIYFMLFRDWMCLISCQLHLDYHLCKSQNGVK